MEKQPDLTLAFRHVSPQRLLGTLRVAAVGKSFEASHACDGEIRNFWLFCNQLAEARDRQTLAWRLHVSRGKNVHFAAGQIDLWNACVADLHASRFHLRAVNDSCRDNDTKFPGNVAGFGRIGKEVGNDHVAPVWAQPGRLADRMSALGRKRTLAVRLPGDPAERPLSARSGHSKPRRFSASRPASVRGSSHVST